MPGDVSMAYPGMPICACQHFKDVHAESGPCAAEGCECKEFKIVALDDTALGEAMDAFLDRMVARRKKMPHSKHKRKPHSGSARRTKFRL